MKAMLSFNPCSNGMKKELVIGYVPTKDGGVLILVLMK